MASTVPSKRSLSVISISPPPLKRRRSCTPDSFSGVPEDQINVFIIDAKLNAETVEELTSLIEEFNVKDATKELQLSSNAENANIIITEVRMRKRLERHLDWNTAKQKAIVSPQWLRDSAQARRLLPCGKYAALGELYEETVSSCPDNSSSQDLNVVHNASTKRRTEICHNHHYACMRYSPLTCPNQLLLEKLSVLRRNRELEGLDMQALSYERAISVLKAFPRHITSNDIQKISELPHIGGKIISKIKEFIYTGDVEECKSILRDPRYQSLVSFTTVYGIGPATARQLFSTGLRTIKDLEKHYQIQDASISPINPEVQLSNPKATKLPELSIKVGLALRDELSIRISRSEVEEIREVIMNELAQIRHGCVCTITGGYRRGKIESSDIDIVISHQDLKSGGEEIKGLCTKLVTRLYAKGMITHLMHLSSFREHNTLRTSHWDSLEKALTVFILPENDDASPKKHIHRRVDLIFAAPEVYWTAVVGWTGSKMFQRDLRLWAKQEKGMKFDSSGISRRHDSKLYFPKSEEEVFELLGLDWIDPTLRNADV